MKYKLDETKERVREYYRHWEGRADLSPAKGMLFQAYLEKQNDFGYMKFSGAKMHQDIECWIIEWDRFHNGYQ